MKSVKKSGNLKRCPWVPEGDELYMKYHDTEWGVPVYIDRKIYEFLVLESFQAGLSWRIVLNKRKAFEKAFANFDPKKVAKFGKKEINALLRNTGIVRNKLKILAAINNAQKFLEVKKEFGTFSEYMWQQVDGKPKVNKFKATKDYPSFTEEALRWSKDLKSRGFKFLGPTVIYSHMQATGMVNDHTLDCFRR